MCAVHNLAQLPGWPEEPRCTVSTLHKSKEEGAAGSSMEQRVQIGRRLATRGNTIYGGTQPQQGDVRCAAGLETSPAALTLNCLVMTAPATMGAVVRVWHGEACLSWMHAMQEK